jgi:tetratricopeptide (TPR) repeat protein
LAIQLNQNYAPAISNLSAIYFQRKDFQKANDYADKALNIDPNYGAAYLNRGVAREMLRDMQGACEDWSKAKELGVDLGKNYFSTNCNN